MMHRNTAGRAMRPISLALRLAAGACLSLSLGLASAADAHAQRLSVLEDAHVATNAFCVASGATAEGVAACPAGHTVVGGGYRISGTGSGAAAVAN